MLSVMVVQKNMKETGCVQKYHALSDWWRVFLALAVSFFMWNCRRRSLGPTFFLP